MIQSGEGSFRKRLQLGAKIFYELPLQSFLESLKFQISNLARCAPPLSLTGSPAGPILFRFSYRLPSFGRTLVPQERRRPRRRRVAPCARRRLRAPARQPSSSSTSPLLPAPRGTPWRMTPCVILVIVGRSRPRCCRCRRRCRCNRRRRR